MNKSGPIVIVDDDLDDLELYRYALKSLNVKNEVLVFTDAEDFLEHMRAASELIFFILCDINMPRMDGFKLREEITLDSSLSSISIPFIFFSTSGNTKHVIKAYESPIQGYFIKPSNFDDILKMFESIITYWEHSSHPTFHLQ